MRPSVLQRIQRLLDGQDHDADPNSGLGYLIIADMVELLGLQVQVISAPGAGTRAELGIGNEGA